MTILGKHISQYPRLAISQSREYRLVCRAHRDQGAFASVVTTTIECWDGDCRKWASPAIYDDECGVWLAVKNNKAVAVFDDCNSPKSGTYRKLTPESTYQP